MFSAGAMLLMAGCASGGPQRLASLDNSPTAPSTNTFYGKIVMGPQAMEGNPKNVVDGDTLKAGYDFTEPGKHAETSVTFYFPPGPPDAFDFKYTCNPVPPAKPPKPNPSGDIYVEPPNATYSDPANSPSWYPTGDQADPASYEGQTKLATGCGGTINLSRGGTFTACITEVTSDPKPDNVNVRWHYSINGSAGGWSATKTVALSTTPYDCSPG